MNGKATSTDGQSLEGVDDTKNSAMSNTENPSGTFIADISTMYCDIKTGD